MRVAPGVYRDRYGFAAVVGGKERRFKPGTPLEVILSWRENASVERATVRAQRGRPQLFPRSPEGWCYVYFIYDGEAMKIGRAVDPLRRLSEFQTSHPRRLRLVVAVPGHAILEAAIHRRFANLNLNGEWFAVNDDLRAFIGELARGHNPIALLWAEEPKNAIGWHQFLKPLRSSIDS